MTSPSEQPIDTNHLGFKRSICAWKSGEYLIDPGPSTSLGPVIEAFADQPPRAILLTHIHLDHAGGTGTLLKRWPGTPVYVHERGAPHMADPERLIASATRLYGDQMERLWGEMVPIDPASIHALSGGEEIEGFKVEYTPGHAAHHVGYLNLESGTAFVGDTGGVRVAPEDFLFAPTPPPDVDVEAWNESLDKIEAWKPQRLAITHFGGFDDAEAHLSRLRENLNKWAEAARDLDAEGFSAMVRAQVEEQVKDPEAREAYNHGAPIDDLYAGLARYWSKRESG